MLCEQGDITITDYRNTIPNKCLSKISNQIVDFVWTDYQKFEEK